MVLNDTLSTAVLLRQAASMKEDENILIHIRDKDCVSLEVRYHRSCQGPVKGNSHMISPDRTRLISILLSKSRLPGHLSPDLWHSMLIISILLIHATTRQQ